MHFQRGFKEKLLPQQTCFKISYPQQNPPPSPPSPQLMAMAMAMSHPPPMHDKNYRKFGYKFYDGVKDVAEVIVKEAGAH